jgi:O-antigen ligase
MLSAFSREQKTPRMGRFSLEQAAAWFSAALLVFSWLTTEHFLPWISWHGEVAAFSAVFLLAWTAALRSWRTHRSRPISVPLLTLPFALIGMVALVQVATGVMTFGGDVVVVWFYLALCITCLIIGFNPEAAATKDDPSVAGAPWTPPALLALVFVLGALASSIVAFAQVFELWPNSAWIMRMTNLRRPGGNLGQPNHLATLALMGVASAAFLHISGRLTAAAAALILFALGAGLAATESRTGVVALIALLAWWQIKRSAVARQVSPWAGPVVGLAFLVMFWGWPDLLNLLQLGDSDGKSRLTGGANLRLAIWPQLLEAVWQRPWWGWGLTEVAKAHNAVAHAYPINEPYSYSHNLVIDWAVWMGVPIALGLVVATGVWLWNRLKKVDQPVTWYCLAVALPLAVHSLLEFPFAYAYFLAPVLLLVGMLERSVGAKPLFRIHPGPASAVLLLFSAAMVWSVIEYLSIEEDFRIVRFEQLRIGRTSVDHHRPDVIIFTQLGTLLSGSRIELRTGMGPDDLEELKKLALRYPWIATQYRYAVALALNGNQQEAVRQLQVLRRQRGEQLYQKIKIEIGELGRVRYPQLDTLVLP